MKMKFRKIGLATPVKSQYVCATTGKACSPSVQYIYSVPERQIKLNCLLLSRKAKEVMDQHYVFEGAVLRAASNAERLFLNQSRYSNKEKQGCYTAYELSSLRPKKFSRRQE